MDLHTVITTHRTHIDSALQGYFEKKHFDLREAGSEIAEENYMAMRNYILGKGKRLRSVMALVGYGACGGKEEEKMLLPALSVEFFHNASLILDDVMDEDKARREIPAAHQVTANWFRKRFKRKTYRGYLFANEESRFAVSMSTIGANMLFSLGAQTILDSSFEMEKKVKALQVYEKTYRLVNLGQMLDMYYEHQKKVSAKQYLRMAYLKTGALLGGALKMGGVLGGGSDKQLRALEDYALYAATTFQIQDDILDVTKGAKKGRVLGSDLRKGKTTILVLEAKEMLDNGDWGKVEKVLGNEKATKAQVNAAIKILHEKGIVESARKLAKQNAERGKIALRRARPTFTKEYVHILEQFADYLMERKA
ncbi:MAG: polyprenyl synthetase family protein [Candidatus Diapherotrites archaeon]|nr:polyprenyl synthetase family protein [Candidatus Diapherotrites archaeon]MDZ4256897.1 polyprenyl synthetase family protein [archaeon]